MSTWKRCRSLDCILTTLLSVAIITAALGRTEPLDNPPPCTDGSSLNVMCVAVDIYDRYPSTTGLIQDHQRSPSYPADWAKDIQFDDGGNTVVIRSFADDATRMTGDGGDAAVVYDVPSWIDSSIAPSGTWRRGVPRNTEAIYCVLTAINAFENKYGDTIGEITLTFGGTTSYSYDLVLGKNIRNWFGGTIITSPYYQEILYVRELDNGVTGTHAWQHEEHLLSAPSGIQNLPAYLDILRLEVPPSLQSERLSRIRISARTMVAGPRNLPVSVKVMGISTRYIPPTLKFEYPSGVISDCTPPGAPTSQYPATLRLVDPSGNTLVDYDGAALEWDSWSGNWAVPRGSAYNCEIARNHPRYRAWTDIGPIPLGTWQVREAGLSQTSGHELWHRLDPINVDPSGMRTHIYIHQTPIRCTQGCIGIYFTDRYDISRTSFYRRFKLAPGVHAAIEQDRMKLFVEDSQSPPRAYDQEPGVDPGWIVRILSPANILVERVDGYKCGYDPATRQVVNDFETTTYTGPDTEPQIITVPGLGTGADTYKIVVSPSGAGGAYTLEISHRDLDGSVTSTRLTGTVTAGRREEYDFEKSDQGILVNGTLPIENTISIDIYPNRTPNQIHIVRNYTIYVGVLGSSTFSVTDLDPRTVKFGPTGTEAQPVRAAAIRDLNRDGHDDALYGFMTYDCQFEMSDTKGVLTGQTTAGVNVTGNDSVVVLFF